MQLRFTSLAVISLRWDFHPQECAHAGRTAKKPGPRSGTGLFVYCLRSDQPRVRERIMKLS
jgi:hypothetical protein